MNRKQGFTLVELLAVIVLLAIVAVISTVQITKTVRESAKSANEINKKQIEKAAEECMVMNNSDLCKTVDGLISGGFLERFEDPIKKSSDNINNDYIIHVESDGKITVTYTGDEQDLKTYSVGEMFCLNKTQECFYVIEDNETTVTALAKWNLNYGINTSDSCDINIQCSDAKGTNENTEYDDENIGTLAFSTTNYWYDASKKKIKAEYGTKYSSPVYDENSNLWGPVNNYESYLKNNLKKSTVSVTLLNYAQVIKLGCVKDGKCPESNSWLYDTSYWLSDAQEKTGIWVIDAIGILSHNKYTQEYLYGIRPVITISKLEM